jgi:hypothetical protein
LKTVKRCYEFYILEATEINQDGVILSSRLFTEFASETHDILDEVLQKHGLSSWVFFKNMDVTLRKEGIWPWAFVLFEEEFQLAGHAVLVRKDRGDFSFTSYSTALLPIGETGVPPLSVILVFNKQSLKKAAEQSELFNMAWQQLSDCSEDQHWVCIADSPSPEWILQTSKGDKELFIRKVCV